MIHTWLGWLIVGIIAVALFGWIPVVGLFYLFQNGPTGTPGELLAGTASASAGRIRRRRHGGGRVTMTIHPQHDGNYNWRREHWPTPTPRCTVCGKMIPGQWNRACGDCRTDMAGMS